MTFMVLFVVLAVIAAIINKFRSKEAAKMVDQGDVNGALSTYKDLFVHAFDDIIDHEGNGHVPSFLTILRRQGRQYLDQIDAILRKSGQNLDVSPYEELIQDVEAFSKQKGVMTLQKMPKKEGKKQFAEFYRRLVAFSKTIPDTVG
jgi:hypothetical protein